MHMELGLDPGIRDAVEALQAGGVETFDSCEGGEGHPSPEPMVRFFGDAAEGFRALAVAMSAGLPVQDLRRFWQIVDGEPCGPYWEIAFNYRRAQCEQSG
jgi:hypothetical protein